MASRWCVLSLGINSPPLPDHPAALFQDFPRGLDRIRERLAETRFPGDFLTWDREYPIGSPRHEETRFAFKPFCFREARGRGYDLALWVDSSIVIELPLDPIFDVIESQGYYIVAENHSVGRFCRDEALEPLDITREESFTMPSAWGSVIGLSLRDARSVRFLDQWAALATDGISFVGPKWSGVRGFPPTASSDPRVQGHRSQSAMSVVALRLGMDRWATKTEFSRYFRDDRRYVRTFDEAPNRDTPAGRQPPGNPH